MNEKEFFLPQSTPYKANLHCHSTVSDGRYTPERLKEIYMAQGYSVVAFSDHNKLIPHAELTDDAFVALNAIEINIDPTPTLTTSPTYHLNFFSPDQNRGDFVPFRREYSTAIVNQLIADAVDEGFLVQYNHPRWSLQTPADFLPLQKLWGFEVFNTGCEIDCANGWGDYEYETSLRAGMRCVPVATDDNHNGAGEDSPLCDSFGGWTMIYADSLTYDDIFCAMKEKKVYASTHPSFQGLWRQGREIHVLTSPCHAVYWRCDSRNMAINRSHRDDITETVFSIPQGAAWFRIEAEDGRGKALTQAYSL